MPDNLIAPLTNHLWQSTVVAAIVWLLAWALRRNHARARYWVWMAASVKFLLPFSLLTSAGEWLRSFFATPIVAKPALASAIEQIARPFPQTQFFDAAQARDAAHYGSFLPAVLSTIWICGVVIVVFRFGWGWSRVYIAKRAGSPLALAADVPVLCSKSPIEPGIFGVFRPVLLLPQGIRGRLSPEQLRAIVAHEMCHVQRHDNLTFAIHMIVEALFWFHPAVWWIGARLIEERERACDEAVLQSGSAAEIYAEGILSVCKFYVESPLECVAGVTGSDLKQRIVRIMANDGAFRLTLSKKFLLAAAVLMTVTVPVVLGLGQTATDEGSWEKAAGGKQEFEVASVRLNPGPMEPSNFRLSPDNAYTNAGGVLSADLSLSNYIEFAYKLQETREQFGSMFGHLPKWVQMDNYEIHAQAPTSNPTKDQMRLMMQTLLKERFAVVIHYETGDAPVLLLTLAKPGTLGPKLYRHEDRPSCDVIGPGLTGAVPKDTDYFPSQCGSIVGVPTADQAIAMGGRNITLSMMAKSLASPSRLGRPMVDGTGLTGNYDFVLKWTPGQGDFGPPSSEESGPDQPGGNFVQALKDQLGLKLISGKAPLKTLVIDHVERPSAN